MNSLADLFPDTDFRFHLTLRRGEPHEFFRATDSSETLLNERRRWLNASPSRYSQLSSEGLSLFAEFLQLCVEGKLLDRSVIDCGSLREPKAAINTLRRVGAELEPDLLFLAPDNEGQFRLRGGVLCFPTGWSLEEKMGRTLDSIHGTVPGLNAALGPPISQFLSKLKPGVAFLRDNWGISAGQELNQHPSRDLPAPEMPVALERLWLRVEHQAVVSLPVSKGVLFGIRIAAHRLDNLPSEEGVVPKLIRALETMPELMASYKRISSIRGPLIDRLRARYII